MSARRMILPSVLKVGRDHWARREWRGNSRVLTARPAVAPYLLAVSVALLVAFTGLGASVARAADAVHNVGMVSGAKSDIRLTVPGGRMPQGGFLPVAVRIANRDAKEATWTLTLMTSPMAFRGGAAREELRSVHRFTVPASTTREFFIYAPAATGVHSSGGAGQLRGEISGPDVVRDSFGMLLEYGWGNLLGPIAAESALLPTIREALIVREGSVNLRRARRSPTPAPVIDQAMARVSVIDPATLPADWRVWSSYVAVVLGTETWAQLDAARRQALTEAVSLGLRLVLVPPNRRDEMKTETVGAGYVFTLSGPLATHRVDEFKQTGIELAAPGTERMGAFVDAGFWGISSRAWEVPGGRGWLTFFVVAFGVLIGPVNLFFFAPAGKRHRLFVTVPLLSVVGSAGLLATILISDGFGGEGTRRALVVLFPERNQAVVFQKQISRTGLLGGREFALPADVLIERSAENAPSALASLVRDGDTASGDWFTSRSTQTHELRQLVPTRERVELLPPAAGAGAETPPVVQSTVGAVLRDFVYRDERGVYWQAAEVPPGVKVTLQAVLEAGLAFRHFTPRVWPPGRFVAVVEGAASPALIPTLASIAWRDEVTLYTGQLAPASQP